MNIKKIFLLSLSVSSMLKAHQLIKVQTIIPTIVTDLKYATPDNFTHQAVYPLCAQCYLIDEAAQALKNVQEELAQQNLGLKIWDTYRPRSVQYIFWNLVPDERYVANPDLGSKHNCGAAVDLTIINLDNGQELDMGTGFDDFTEKAWIQCTDISKEAQENRTLLQTVMCKHGFIPIPTEWWHFNLKNWHEYPFLDISFEELNESDEALNGF